ncbi:hypothetical protein GQ607_000745 [Colletotrichum asianum]|uniref:Uncharacterized protein n=1 Tax=Colletotrichum asianum TaxID=702518 RepID=A0A8H3WS16_9PEZI|nr:hypothetical protein GQ607_000745 [Colletotrichum asianum]
MLFPTFRHMHCFGKPSICQPCVVKEQDKKREPTNAKQSRGRITMNGVVIVKGK